MAQITLQRSTDLSTTTVNLDLLEEGGSQLLSTSFGKPEVNVRDSGGTQNPRIQDQWSALENYEIRARISGAFAYEVAHTLADMIKTASPTPLTLQIPDDVYPDKVRVAPGAGQEGALTLSFDAGKKDDVLVGLSLTRVGDVDAATEQPATTPTASGSGPIQLTAGGTTIDLPKAGLSVERSVGRPNDVVRRQPQQSDPRYLAKAKVSSDVFTFAFESVEQAKQTLNGLTSNIFRNRLGRRGVRVNFNGMLGLGEFAAIPVGSSPFRQTHQAGQSWVGVPTLELRRVYDTTQ